MSQIGRGICLGVALLLVFALCGCWVPAVNPLFEESDTLYDHSLEGTWTADSGESITFTRDNSGRCYDIVYVEKGNAGKLSPAQDESSNLHGCLGQFGKSTLLDVMPGETKLPEALAAHLLPVHSFWRIETGIDTLSVQSLSESYFKDLATKKKLRLAQVNWNGEIVLTASTRALQNYFKRNADFDEIYSSKEEFQRKK